MDSFTLALVALSAAVGFSLVEFVFRRRRRGGLYATVLVLTMAAVAVTTRYAIHAFVRTPDLDRSMVAMPILDAVDRLEPAVAAELHRLVAASSVDAIPQIRSRTAALARTHAPTASDDSVVRLVRTIVKNAEGLLSQDPTLCLPYLFPERDGGVDLAKRLGRQAEEAEVSALAGVLDSAARSPQPAPRDKDIERPLRTLGDRLAAQYTRPELAVFEKGVSAAAGHRALVCRMTVDVFKDALALPPSQQGPVLRHLLNDPRVPAPRAGGRGDRLTTG